MKRRLATLLLAATALDGLATTAGPTPPPVRPTDALASGAGSAASPPAATTAGTSAATAAKKAAIGLELPAGAKPAAATPGMVWLHPKTNSYRCPGDPQYGQGRDGMLLKETEVEQNGARPQMGKRCW